MLSFWSCLELLEVEMQYENILSIQFQKGTQEMSCIVRECSILFWTVVAGLESISKQNSMHQVEICSERSVPSDLVLSESVLTKQNLTNYLIS